MKNISIIIPSCTFEHLKVCLESIVRNTDLDKYDAEVVLSLNGCDIEAIDFIRNLGPNFRFIWIDRRIGLCNAANLAAKVCDCNYVIRIDEDTVILDWGKDIWIDMLLQSFWQEKIAQVGVVVHNYGEYKSVVGFLTMTRKSVWEQVGGWDVECDKADTEIGEDTSFSIKIQKLGYEVAEAGEHVITGISHMPFVGTFPVQHYSNGSWRNKN